MKAVMIEDEPLLLEAQKNIVESLDEIELVGTYTSTLNILQEIEQKRPDLVFLDIELMGKNGIEVADVISEKFPFIHIVFITAYSQYAVAAFEVNAIDYILKPLSRDRLLKTYKRLKAEKEMAAPEATGARIQTFSTLKFFDAEGNTLPVKWRTSKARELFLLLLHHSGEAVTKDYILAQLWPEGTGEKAYNQLYTTIYQIRTMLRSLNLDIQINSQEEYYILQLNDIRVDVHEWQEELEKFREVSDENLGLYLETMKMYQGDYLKDSPFLWIEASRERLRMLWCSHMRKIADFYISRNLYREAIDTLVTIQHQHPYLEDIYFMLMKLYGMVSERYEVEKQYAKLKEMLAEQLGTAPEPSVQEWYAAWRHAKIRDTK